MWLVGLDGRMLFHNEVDAELGTTRAGLHIDITMVPPHEPPGDFQAEACTLSGRLGCEEGVEDSG